MTIGEKYTPAMSITEQAAADDYFAMLVRSNLTNAIADGKERTQAEAEAIERDNLGYFAGYFDDLTRLRVEKLFKCEHPFFGSIAKNGPPTMEQALKAGMQLAEGHSPIFIKANIIAENAEKKS